MVEDTKDFLVYFDRQVGRDGEIDEAITTVVRARAELADWENRLKLHKRSLGQSERAAARSLSRRVCRELE